MLNINYCRDGIAISDYLVEDFVDSVIIDYKSNPVDKTVLVSSEILILVFEERMLKGDISSDDISFFIEGEQILFHKIKGLILPENKDLGISFAEYTSQIIHYLYQNKKHEL